MKNKKWNLLFIIFSVIFLIYFITKEEGITGLIKNLCQVNPFWIIGAIFMMIIYWCMEAGILHIAIKNFHHEQAFPTSLKTSMIGQFFNCVTPFSSGGQPMQAYHMVKSGVPLGSASCSLMVKFIVYQFVLTIYSGVTLLLQFNQFSDKISGMGFLVLTGFGINAAVILGLLCICFFRRQTDAFLTKVISILVKLKIIKHEEDARKSLRRELDSFYDGFQIIQKNIWLILSMGIMTAVQLTGYFMIPYFIFKAFNLVGGSIFAMLSAEAFVLNISSFVPLPGAAGGAELSFHTMFALFFPSNLLNLSILIWRLITFYLPILIGMLFVLENPKKKVLLK